MYHSFKILVVEDIWKVILKEKKVQNDMDYKNGLSSLLNNGNDVLDLHKFGYGL